MATLVDLLLTRGREDADHSFRYLSGREPAGVAGGSKAAGGEAAESRLTFGQLDLRAKALAATLIERGLAGQRALLCYPPGVEFMVGLFGSLYAGLVAVPAYPPRAHKPDGRLTSIAASCRPGVILATAGLVASADDFAKHNPSLAGIPWLAESDASGAERWEGLRRDRVAAARADDLAILQYTSGSTGDPKGVMLTHSCVLHNLHVISESMDLRRGAVGVSWLPAFHDMGLIGNLLGTLYFPGHLTLLSPLTVMQDPFRWLQAISQTGAYISGGPCFAYDLCVKRVSAQQRQQLDLSKWRLAYTGAEPISPRVMDEFCRVFAECGFSPRNLYPCYGLAEASLMVTGPAAGSGARTVSFAADALAAGRAEVVAPQEGVLTPAGKEMVSCGRAVVGLEIRIVDGESGRCLPEGEVGEVWVSGPSVAAGYFERPEATRETFGATLPGSDKTFLRTGDLGFLHGGELYIAGRLKDVLILRGRNYYPQDIEENALLSSSHLRPAGAAAFTQGESDSVRLILVAEVQRSYKPGDDAVFDAARARIAFEVGVELGELVLIRTGSLPRTSSGKVARTEVRQRYLDGTLDVVDRFTMEDAPAPPADAAAGDIRTWLVGRLAQQLNLSPGQVDAERPFAAYGLDSVAMVSIASDLEKRLGRRLSPTLLYSAPTINALVRTLSAHETGPASSGEPAAVQPQQADRRVAVIGIGCRLPGADGVDAFWELLRSGAFAVRELPQARRADCRLPGPMPAAGYLDDVRHFDASFFALTQREASCIDPQHRLLLEVAYHALEDAALAVDRLAGSRTGVFVGIAGHDYGRLLLSHAGPDAYLGIGNAASMAAHRLSYHLDLHGPSLAVDTACSSSLSAVHLACQSLRAGDCDLALAGGVNLILTPDVTASLTRAGMLSAKGQCKTFSADADGYVRGEGCAVVVLKPLAAALRDGDPVHAVIEATATNQDGRSNGITAPSGVAQTALVRKALAEAGRTPREVGAVEAHGTGTSLGDPIEFDALAEALGEAQTPCALSAVKTNIGHLEAAAGIAGLVKAALQLERGQLAPHLHLDQVNPLVRLEGSRFFVPRRLQDWPADAPRVAGVSSFGFGGTNVHALLAAAPSPEAGAPGMPAESSRQGRYLLPLSARNEAALRELAASLAAYLRSHPQVRLADVSRTLGLGRTHMPLRLVVSGATPGEAAEALQAYLQSGRSGQVTTGKAFDDSHARVGFLFTGQGAAYAGMARRLDEAEPVFRATLDRCSQILGRCAGFDLREVLQDARRVDETEFGQPALFAFSYAAAELWRSWGVVPAGVLGHSVGEYVAACQAGVFSLEEGLELIAQRGRLMQRCPPGSMLACLAAAEQVRPTLERWGGRISLAADNGPRQCVLSGDAEAVAAAEAELTSQGIGTRPLRVGRAFHSALMEPAFAGLRAAAAKVTHYAPAVPLASNVTGGLLGGPPSPDYWVEHARAAVRFEAGLKTLHRGGITHFIEIGPAAVLTRLGAQCLPGGQVVWLPSQRGESDDGGEIFRSLSRLHADGVRIDWHRLTEGGRRIALPGYPFQRRPFWVDDLPRAEPASPVEPPASEPASEVSPEGRRPQGLALRSCWAQAIERRPAGFDRGVAERVAGVIDEVLREHSLDDAMRLRPEFDRLAGLYVVSALAQLGWRPRAGEAVDLAGLAGRLNLPARQQRLLGRMLGLAAEDGWLTWDGARGEVRSLPPADEPGPVQAALLQKYPDFDVELRLADHCARNLAGVLTGEVDPLQVLFGSEAGTLTEEMYSRSPVARFYNALLTRATARLIASLPAGRPVRILELGAGTGGTTQALLPLLPAERCEYVFSDVSSLFLARAREKFAAHAWIDCRVLDLEQDLQGQNFAEGQFDLILAANVLHATADLRQSVRHARRLLAPGGLLVLLEGTGPRRLLDLIFGLTEGWWRFRDTDLRPDYPLVAPAAWATLLREEGFAGTLALPDGCPRLPDPDQVVLLAWADESRRPLAAPPAPAAGWQVCGDESELLGELTRRLRSQGQSVVASAPETFEGVRSRLNGSAPSRLVVLPGAVVPLGDGATLDQVWLVSCGQADWPAPQGNERRLDLDPRQPAADQAATLAEALLRPDDARVAVYRDDQRYVLAGAAAADSGTTLAAELPPVEAPDRATLLAASPFERRTLVDRYLRQELARLLGSTLSDEDMEMPVQSLGLDSLMAIQVRNRVETSLGVALSLVDFLKGLRVRQLVENIVKQLPQKADRAGAEKVAPPGKAGRPGQDEPARAAGAGERVSQGEVRSLSESELDSLLVSLLEGPADPR